MLSAEEWIARRPRTPDPWALGRWASIAAAAGERSPREGGFMDPEVWKAILSLAVAIVTLGLTWLVGNRVTAFWSERQKRRELELALANSFYSHYGEFRAVWRLWNWSLKKLASDKDAFSKARSELLDRACRAEGGMEAALLKVASERVLDDTARQNLGNLRQAFQVLRERIEEGIPVSYGASEHEDYLEFKRLATWFGTLLAARPAKRVPDPTDAYKAFREITHNKYEPRWKKVGRDVA